MSIEELFSKRRQIRAAWDTEKIPSKELIYDLLSRTLKIAPSKQNMFPFKVHAFGPNDLKEKHNVSQICRLYTAGSVNDWDENDEVVYSKKKQTHKDAPWILVFELRKCEPNRFIKEYGARHDNGNAQKRFTQIDENRFRESPNRALAAIEVGMYCKLLAGICLENNLGISYIKSFPEWDWQGSRSEYHKDKNKAGLDWDSLPQITEIPLLVVQIGYKANMIDQLATNAVDDTKLYLEDKPSIDTIVQFND